VITLLPALLSGFIAAQPAAAPPPEPVPEAEIVVTGARPGKCRVKLAEGALSERQLEHHAGEWARLGLAIRVAHPVGTHYRCLARIAFRLNDQGVRLVHFVERAGSAPVRGSQQ